MFRLLLLFLFFSSICHGQVAIKFGLFKDSLIHVPVKLNSNDSLTVFRFYVSDLRITKDRNKSWKAPKKHYLIDFDRETNGQDVIKLELPHDFKTGQIEFVLGIDSKTSAEGIGEGALDPVNGMYWTWQSGYINFKMEGVSKNIPSRKNRFQLHLGGFRKPYISAQKVDLNYIHKGTSAMICFDLSVFMNALDLYTQHTIMSPSKEAVALSKLAKSCFYVE